MEQTENTPRPLVVCDAGPLIHLDEIGCLDLLTDFSAADTHASACENEKALKNLQPQKIAKIRKR